MFGIYFNTGEIFTFGVQNPAYGSIVYWHANEGAKNLREEHCSWGNVHVVTNLLVLQHILCTVPCITSNGAIYGSPNGIFMALDAVYHQTI